MAYAAQADLVPARLSQQELIELTDDANEGIVNATVVTAILDRASSVLDSYARGRHDLPLIVSEQVKGLTLDIAVFFLFERRRRVQEEVAASYDRAISFLRDVSNGKASLDQPTKTQTSYGAVKTRDHTTDPETFDPNKMENF